VTGIVDPKRFVTNALAQPGDALILTRPLGTGAISTAIKRGIASASAVEASVKVMTTSAALASREMQELGAHACTDITGFGLLGHAYEMARASKACLVIESQRVPLLPDVLSLISKGMLTRGDKNNRLYVGDTIEIRESLSSEMKSALFDPQTAGGLLISIDRSKAAALANRIEGAMIIGEVEEYSEFLIRVI
jgi:selenide,water dikinase